MRTRNRVMGGGACVGHGNQRGVAGQNILGRHAAFSLVLCIEFAREAKNDDPTSDPTHATVSPARPSPFTHPGKLNLPPALPAAP
jgi:hypothetical protein